MTLLLTCLVAVVLVRLGVDVYRARHGQDPFRT